MTLSRAIVKSLILGLCILVPSSSSGDYLRVSTFTPSYVDGTILSARYDKTSNSDPCYLIFNVCMRDHSIRVIDRANDPILVLPGSTGERTLISGGEGDYILMPQSLKRKTIRSESTREIDPVHEVALAVMNESDIFLMGQEGKLLLREIDGLDIIFEIAVRDHELPRPLGSITGEFENNHSIIASRRFEANGETKYVISSMDLKRKELKDIQTISADYTYLHPVLSTSDAIILSTHLDKGTINVRAAKWQGTENTYELQNIDIQPPVPTAALDTVYVGTDEMNVVVEGTLFVYEWSSDRSRLTKSSEFAIGEKLEIIYIRPELRTLLAFNADDMQFRFCTWADDEFVPTSSVTLQDTIEEWDDRCL